MLSKLSASSFALLSSVLLLAAIVFVLARQQSLAALTSVWERTDTIAVYLAIFIMLVAQVAMALRVLIITRADGAVSVKFPPLVRIQYISQFIAYAAPISALSDIAKAAMLKLRFSLPTGQSIRIILYERICGALGAVILGIAATISQYFFLPTQTVLIEAQFALWICGLVGLAVLLGVGGRQIRSGIGVLDRAVRAAMLLGVMLRKPLVIAQLLLVTFVQLVGFALVFIVLANGMHIGASAMRIVLFMPFIFFVSSLPIFYQGWGGREAIVIATIGETGTVSSTEAIALSVAFGAVVFLSSLPGAVFWVMRPSMRKAIRMGVE